MGRKGQSEETAFNLGPRDKDLEKKDPRPRNTYARVLGWEEV